VLQGDLERAKATQEAWAQGRAMTLEEAISYALEEEEAGG
jgi:hypothetical protein